MSGRGNKRRDAKRRNAPKRSTTGPSTASSTTEATGAGTRARTGAETGSGTGTGTGTGESERVLAQLVSEGLHALSHRPELTQSLNQAIDGLVDLDGRDGPGVYRAEGAVAEVLLPLVNLRWEQGWEPADLVHVVRRQSNARLTRLAVATVADSASALPIAEAPPRWVDQLEALAVTTGAAPAGAPTNVVTRWRVQERLGVAESLENGLRLACILRDLPSLEPLEQPPSRWGQAPSNTMGSGWRHGTTSAPEPKVLGTIRALLAKAESTSFPAEAEAFTAKAQDLMSRHAIDAAVLAARAPRDLSSEVAPTRVHIDNPYGKEKAQLLAIVADINGGRVVWDDQLGLATLVGFPLDLELVELLFTSLLIQATQAATSAAQTSPHSRSPSFRRAFLLAYGVRIGERLQHSHQQAGRAAEHQYGTALVPIMAERRDAVGTVTDRLFPDSRPMRPRMVDAQGWNAGRLAANLADIRAARAALN